MDFTILKILILAFLHLFETGYSLGYPRTHYVDNSWS